MFYGNKSLETEIINNFKIFWDKKVNPVVKTKIFAPITSESSVQVTVPKFFAFSITQFNSNCGLMSLYDFQVEDKKFEPYAIALIIMPSRTLSKSSIIYHKDIVNINNPNKFGFKISKTHPLVFLNIKNFIKPSFVNGILLSNNFIKKESYVYPHFYEKIKNPNHKKQFKIQST